MVEALVRGDRRRGPDQVRRCCARRRRGLRWARGARASGSRGARVHCRAWAGRPATIPHGRDCAAGRRARGCGGGADVRAM